MSAPVVFDLDGTLIETEELWGDVRREFALSHGGRWHAGAQAAMIGLNTAEWSRFMRDELGVPLPPDAIARGVVDELVRRMSVSVPVLPGADEALARLAPAYPLALATAATRAVVDAVLATTGWHRYFRAVVSADEVSRGKPFPDVYLRALALLDADARRSVAVEDSANGVRSAHAAGMAVVAIPNRAFPPPADALALADRVLHGLDALDAGLVDDVVRSRAARA
ncbi:MAG TPA: HAD family phosphatase [Candidatus Baltobacteraceae bacterium]|nr:HAD family phosphatase [Candidatus Baltobacteraceae bacterium]